MIERLKQNKSLLIIFIIAMVLIITGITFSLYNVLFKGNKNQTLTIGDINFTYDEKTNGLSLDNNDILSDEDGLKQTKYFDFDISLTSTNNTSITYQIAIEENTTSTLSNDKVKVYLTDQEDNKILDPISIDTLSTDDKGYRKLYINTINTNETQKYRLRAWVDTSKAFEIIDNNGSHSLTMTSATYKFKINVYDTKLPTGADTLIKLTDNKDDSGLYTITHAADSTLQIGTNESITEYRYQGSSPKNYVTFNNETWKIIGVFATDDGTGKIENRIKIIRNESIGYYYWNECTYLPGSAICDDTNKFLNDWTGATLNTYLNGTYLTGLTSTSQSMIGNAKYYLGGSEEYDIQKDVMYQHERKISGSTYYYGTNPNSWTGKIALMYASDYGYAAGDVCTKTLDSYNDTTCTSNNWLYTMLDYWLLAHQVRNGTGMSFVFLDGGVEQVNYVSSNQLAARPVLYLTSNVQITGGSGTSSDPYTLGL